MKQWPTYGGSLSREFSRAKAANLTAEDARKLVPLWRFQTGAVVTASPIIAHVNMPSGDRERLLFIPSWDGHLYALRPEDGSSVWSYRFKPHPGASFPQAGSATVAAASAAFLGGVWVLGGVFALPFATGATILFGEALGRLPLEIEILPARLPVLGAIPGS